jgi:hypothetical protein
MPTCFVLEVNDKVEVGFQSWVHLHTSQLLHQVQALLSPAQGLLQPPGLLAHVCNDRW